MASYCVRYRTSLPKEQADALDMITERVRHDRLLFLARRMETPNYMYLLLDERNSVFDEGWLTDEIRDALALELVPHLISSDIPSTEAILSIFSIPSHPSLQISDNVVFGEPMAIELLRREEIVKRSHVTEYRVRPPVLSRLCFTDEKTKIPPHLANLSNMMTSPKLARFADPATVWIFVSLPYAGEEREKKWLSELKIIKWHNASPPQPLTVYIESEVGAIGLVFSQSSASTRFVDLVSAANLVSLRETAALSGVPRVHFDVPVPIHRGGIAAVLHAKSLLCCIQRGT